MSLFFCTPMKDSQSKRVVILASASPRRQLLLRQIGLRFVVRPSSVSERFSAKETPAANAKRIALEKAGAVARGRLEGIIIGADTVVVVENRILGKPRTRAEAARMLRLLSGRWHTVITGYALVDAETKRHMSATVRTRVKFRKLGREEIRRYVASGSPMDKAGAYGIQDDYGAVFVEEVRGCFYNVVGFPLSRFLVSLSEFLSEPVSNLAGR